MLVCGLGCFVLPLISFRPMAALSRICPWREQPYLVVKGECPEILPKLLLALAVDEVQSIQEFALKLKGLHRKQQVDITIDQRVLRPWSIGRWNNHITQRNQGLILLVVEESRFPVRIG